MKGNSGHIANVLERFYNILLHNELMTSVLYSFWQADNHQICWGT